MTDEDQGIVSAKSELRQHLHRVLQRREVFHGRPTERLAAMIAAQLIGPSRHSPWSLCLTLTQIDELRARLVEAKV